MANAQVVESGRYLIDRGSIDARGHDWTNMLSGAYWLLSRDAANVGEATDVMDIRTVTVETFDDMPDVMIYYRVEPECVRLLTIREIDPDDDFF